MLSNKAKIEAILLVAGSKGISITELKKVFIDKSAEEIRNIIKDISTNYENDENCGFIVKIFGNVYYLLSKPELKSEIEKIVNLDKKTELSQAVMETLAIIVYNEPCAISVIENIRGTNCDSIVKKLENWELIKCTGRGDGPGKPYLYTVGPRFFNMFGIKTLNSLPKIEEVDSFDDSDFFETNRVEEIE